jgi:hypothetical protein
VNFGKCTALERTNKRRIHKDEIVPKLSQKQYDQRPLLKNFGESHICGNEFISSSRDQFRGSSSTCWTQETCDDPLVRNNFTSRLNLYIKVKITNSKFQIHWIMFSCDNWHLEASDRISESIFDMNMRYARVGIQFNSSMTIYPCRGSDGKQNYTTISINQAITAVPIERGVDWQKEGSLMVVVGVPVQSDFNGFFFQPPSGYGFLNQHVVGKGSQTASHEVGHGFGLEHIFKGVSETSGCDTCRETIPSDFTGDFCEDTPPIPRNFQCWSPLIGGDACDQGRWYWKNPYTNVSNSN